MKIKTEGASGGFVNRIKSITSRDIICFLAGTFFMAVIL